jgi:hypothetical protein
LVHSLIVKFTYDHSTGLYGAELQNGAKFAVRREDISGKLENALNLFRRGVIALLEDQPLRMSVDKKQERETLQALTEGRPVQRVGPIRKPKLNLDDLDI